MLYFLTTVLVLTSTLVAGQRPPIAGSRPIGYPALLNRTTTPLPGELADRFGEGTTQRLPIQANGDRELIDRLSKLPIDKQPFWFINWQAQEELMKKPQTYPQRPSGFVDPVSQSAPSFSNGQAFSSSPSSSSQSNIQFDGQGIANNQRQPVTSSTFSNANNVQSFSNGPVFTNQQRIPNPNLAFTNSINGFVLTDPALVYANPENFNSNPSNQRVQNRPLSQKPTFSIPHQGLTTLSQGFSNQNQGSVTPSQSFQSPNKGFSSTSSGFASNVDVSSLNPNLNSRFSASSSATSNSSSSNKKVGDVTNYNYQWNKTFSNSYKYMYNYTTHSTVRVPQQEHHVTQNTQEYHIY